jgi:hypothetical protein
MIIKIPEREIPVPTGISPQARAIRQFHGAPGEAHITSEVRKFIAGCWAR